MSSLLRRESAIIPMTPAADHSALRGYFVEVSSGAASVCNSADDIPLGVILEGAPTTGQDTIAVCGGGAGVVAVKCAASAGSIAIGTKLVLHTDGTVKADPGTGGRVQVAIALEVGANGALIDAVLIDPVFIAAAVPDPLAVDAIVSLTAAADHTGKEGYFVEVASGDASISNAATDIPYGVILAGAAAEADDTLAVSGSGLIAPVMLAAEPGTVGAGTYLVLHTDGTAKADPGSGDRVQVARSVEDGTGGALVRAVLINPVFIDVT